MRIEKKMKGREDGAAKKELMQLAKMKLIFFLM